MVLGTPAHQQLDAPSPAAAVARACRCSGRSSRASARAIVVLCVRARDDWAPALVRGLVAVRARHWVVFRVAFVPRAPSGAAADP